MSNLPSLPSLPVLQAWVHRPQALAKCFISDIYSLSTLLPEGYDPNTVSYGTRGNCFSKLGFVKQPGLKLTKRLDVFLLDQFPCKMVEIVGWIAGVDDKESKLDITVDDGDGKHVLMVIVKLSLVSSKHNQPSRSAQINTNQNTSTHFLSAKQRAAQKKTMVNNVSSNGYPQPISCTSSFQKVYQKKDIRVGDTVKVVGRVDEWFRKRNDGSGDWVRQVIVEEGGGGSIVVVHPQAQTEHIKTVLKLHQTLYSSPFKIPTHSLLSSPTKSNTQSSDRTITSEISNDEDDAELRDPSLLRSSQLTDHTFRRYLMDYMTRQTKLAFQVLENSGPENVKDALEDLFPEYREINIRLGAGYSGNGNGKGKERSLEIHKSDSFSSKTESYTPVFKTSTKSNQPDSIQSISDHRHSSIQKITPPNPQTHQSPPIHPHPPIPSTLIPSNRIGSLSQTPQTLCQTPHLKTLASLIIQQTSKKSEKARRERYKLGISTVKDRKIEEDRLRFGKKKGDWVVEGEDLERRIGRLVDWGIRCISEDGEVVQVSSSSSASASASLLRKFAHSNSELLTPYISEGGGDLKVIGYIPLPPCLLLELVIPHFILERQKRARIFLKKSDERFGNGMTLNQLFNSFKCWGEDGRWERMGEFCLEEAVRFGVAVGRLSKVGRGWWVVDE